MKSTTLKAFGVTGGKLKRPVQCSKSNKNLNGLHHQVGSPNTFPKTISLHMTKCQQLTKCITFSGCAEIDAIFSS